MLAAKEGCLWVATHATNRGQILSITAHPHARATSLPPLTCHGQEAGWAAGKHGRGDEPCTPHTTALSFPHPQGPPEPGKRRVSAARPLPELRQARRTPLEAKAPMAPAAISSSPLSPSPPLAFPSPLLRTRANCEAAPATSGALPGPPRQAPAARSVRWGFQARSSCGLWVRPEPAESTHHGVCARGGGGCPRGEARPKGPRRRRRQRNRTPAAA